MIEVRLDRARAIPGYMHEEELHWLARHAAERRRVIEVGSFKGRSTRAMADHCPGTVTAIDPWDGGYVNDNGSQARWLDTKSAWKEFRHNLQDHILSHRVIPMVMPFHEASPDLTADMVFLDGDHRYEAVLADIDRALTYLETRGLICGHDYGHKKWPGVKRAVDERFGGRIQLCRTIWWVEQ